MNLTAIQTALNSSKGCRFVSLVYRAKGTGELARHTLLMGANLSAAYRADSRSLARKLASLSGVARIACEELLASLRESLAVGIGNNSANTRIGVFDTLAKGIKVHKETGLLYINGFSVKKEIMEPGTYKTVNSSEKTLAKNALRREGKLGKFREFVIHPDNIQSISGNGKTLVFA